GCHALPVARQEATRPPGPPSAPLRPAGGEEAAEQYVAGGAVSVSPTPLSSPKRSGPSVKKTRRWAKRAVRDVGRVVQTAAVGAAAGALFAGPLYLSLKYPGEGRDLPNELLKMVLSPSKD